MAPIGISLFTTVQFGVGLKNKFNIKEIYLEGNFLSKIALTRCQSVEFLKSLATLEKKSDAMA